MHRDHHDHDHDHGDHDHEHDEGLNGHAGHLEVEMAAPGPGHNHARAPQRPAQWQTPHLTHDRGAHEDHSHGEPDLDLVEAAFVQGFTTASDPTSFLRLARIPFETDAPDGARLVLLRVETDAVTDVGGITPHLGGGSVRYDPLPARLVSHRRRLRFVYYDGGGLRPLSLAQVRELPGG